MDQLDATVYFVGTAGAGKSTLVAAYDRWLREHGMTSTLVNLDPGADALPYQPDVDIRDTLQLADIMEEHGLGPNGAQIAAADMIALDLEDIQAEINSFRADQVLIDTPGQLELFVFRQAGKHIVESLAPNRSVVAYLMDPFLARTPSGFASQLMLGATTLFRFQEPMVFLLSKADVMGQEDLGAVTNWAADLESLEAAIQLEVPSMSQTLAGDLTRLLDNLGTQKLLTPTSAQDGRGLDDLYAQIQSAIGGFEDSTPEYDTFLGPGQEEAK